MNIMDQESISEHIRVYCRLRPELPEDSGGEGDFYLTGDDASTSGTCITSSSRDGDCVYSSSSTKREHKFKLDGFFGPTTTQEQLYDIAVKPIVDSALKGYSGTIFAYGPTGSGKTYTMAGEGEGSKGVIPRVFDQLLAEASSSRGLVNISVSYLQIYCELVTDLLDPRPATLSIREKPGGNIYVENLSEIVVTTYSDVADLLQRGERNRCTAATNTNSSSSRSHAAILIKITTPDDKAPATSAASKDGGVAVKESTLVLVDLAGSERATAVEGRNYLRAEESKSINLSLSALGNCISALSSQSSTSAEWKAGGGGGLAGGDRVRHIPYRDSKLTRLLQGSLGGGARTAVIVNLPPGSDSTGEVLNALRFASRCAMVSVVAKVHRVVDYESLFMKLQQKLDAQEQREREQQFDIDKQYELVDEQERQIDSLKEEITILKRQLESMRPPTGGSALSPQQSSVGESSRDDGEWAAKIDEISAEHLKEMNEMRERYEKRVAAYKRAAAEATQEVSVLQQDLKVERERHLEALKDLNVMNERHNEAERSFDLRVQELLEDIEANAKNIDTEERVADLEKQLEEKNIEIELLEQKVNLIQGGAIEGMVSRAQVEEMEAVFADTIDRLSARVVQLEESKSTAPSRMAPSGSSAGLPAVPPRGARMEPGRIRPSYDAPIGNRGGQSKVVRGRF